MDSLPVACTLSLQDYAARKTNLIERLVSEAEEIEPLAEGYRFRFVPTDGLLEALMNAIRKERRCCRFLAFGVEVTPDEGPVWLEMYGPEGTKRFLETLLDLEQPGRSCHPET